jgi:uncharacterized protein YqhQ
MQDKMLNTLLKYFLPAFLISKSEEREAKLYGGQAILEGVMMKGATKAVASVRAPDGTIVSKVMREIPEKKAKDWKQTPFIRGIFVLVDSLSLGMTALRYSADVAVPEEEGKANPLLESLAMIIPIFIAIGVFFILPTKLPEWIGMKDPSENLLASDPRAFWLNLFEGGVRIIIFIGYILAISLIKDIKRVFMYHGAEHKTVNAYEGKVPLTVENVQKFTTAHYRCGTSFLFIVVIVHILLAALFGFSNNVWIRTAIRLGTLIPVASISYELLRFSAAHKSNILCQMLFSPGLAFQKITALQPDDQMVEVAIHAFRQVIPEDDPAVLYYDPTLLDDQKKAKTEKS